MIKFNEATGVVTFRGAVIGIVTSVGDLYRTSSPYARLPPRTFRTLRDAIAYVAS